ncbi:MAG: Hint domain-containing protein [Rhodobacteraceae bacterium]|nr:Hint domain-containing protein [Paracoccaceae bacterium]
MKLAFYEIFGDPDRDGQFTVTREGRADLAETDDVYLNQTINIATTCSISECEYKLEESQGKTIIYEGVVCPDTRQQRLIRFARIQGAGHQTSSCRIVLFSGVLKRGEAVVDVIQVEHSGDLLGNSMICFTPGSRILTAFGDIPVENLRPGDLIHTADNGLQPLRWIGQRQLSSVRLHVAPHLRPVKIAKHSFGPGMPATDIRVSPSHRFVVDNLNTSLLFGQEEVLIPARGLIDGVNVFEDKELGDVLYIHLLFDEHQVVFVEGTPTESFYPCPKSLMALEETARNEVFAVLPHLENHPLNYSPAARHSLRIDEAQLLLAA